MSRKWPIFILLAVFGVCILTVPVIFFSGADKERSPVLGMWTGGFYTDEAEVLRGYLQLYRTGDKFKMRLGTKDQEMNFDGKWTVAKKRIELRVTNIDFQNPTNETQKAMGLFIFDPDEVRAAYSKPITLDIDDSKLSGLTISIGKLQGRHRFQKGQVTPNAQRALDKITGKD